MATSRSKAKRNETLELVLVFGQKRLPMLVSLDGSDRPGDSLTIGHLSDAVTEVSQVKPECQKLIYRGRTLFNNDRKSTDAAFETTLSSLGIKNGERIMLLGRKPQDTNHTNEEKSPLKDTKAPDPDRLAELRSRLDTISARLQQEVDKIAGMKDVAELKSLRLTLRGLHEETMKLLETVDSTREREDSVSDFRTQRKALVNSIQSKLDQCENCLADITDKIKSLEEEQEQSGQRT